MASTSRVSLTEESRRDGGNLAPWRVDEFVPRLLGQSPSTVLVRKVSHPRLFCCDTTARLMVRRRKGGLLSAVSSKSLRPRLVTADGLHRTHLFLLPYSDTPFSRYKSLDTAHAAVRLRGSPDHRYRYSPLPKLSFYHADRVSVLTYEIKQVFLIYLGSLFNRTGADSSLRYVMRHTNNYKEKHLYLDSRNARN